MPTSYLLDTNAVTALVNGISVALGHLHGLVPTDELYTCFIVVGEWEYGILNAQGKQKQAQIRVAGTAIFSALTAIWESTPAVALQYGALHAQLRIVGQIFDDLILKGVLPENAVQTVQYAVDQGCISEEQPVADSDFLKSQPIN